MSTSGFERLPVIRKALAAIHTRIKAHELRSEWPTFDVPLKNAPRKIENVIYVENLARMIAHHYRLRDTTFVVRLNSTLSAAAQIEVRNANEIFVDYKPTETVHAAELCAVMAHELAHIFLHRIGLAFDQTLEDEILTDTTSIYLGFGPYFLSAQRDKDGYNFGQRTVTQRRVGYISVAEMGYVLYRRDHLRNERSSAKITSGVGQIGYWNGGVRFNHERNQRPFVARSLVSRIMHRFGWIRVQDREKIVFDCPVCVQPIRIPALHKTLEVSCPNCREKLRCFS